MLLSFGALRRRSTDLRVQSFQLGRGNFLLLANQALSRANHRYRGSLVVLAKYVVHPREVFTQDRGQCRLQSQCLPCCFEPRNLREELTRLVRVFISLFPVQQLPLRLRLLCIARR